MSNEPSSKLSRLGARARRLARSLHLRAAGILLLLLVGFFARTLFTDKLNSPADILQIEPTLRLESMPAEFIPQNALSGDAVIQFEPWYQFARRSLQIDQSGAGSQDGQREFPWWNPYQGNGVPHFANSQSALLYPLTWLPLLLGDKWGLLALMAAKLFLIGFFTYCYLREIRVRHYPALFGAAAFMFAGSNLVWLYWPIPTVMFVLPLGLWLVERITKRPQALGNYIGFAVAIAAGFLAGHVQTFVHCMLIVALYALALLVFRKFPGRWRGLKQRAYIAIGLLVAALIGLALTGIQLLPFAEYLQHSFELVARSSLAHNPYWLLARYLGLNLVPDLLGNQAWSSWLGSPQMAQMGFVASATTNYNDVTSGYVGLLVTVSAIGAILARPRSKRIWFFVILAVGSAGLVYRAPWFALVTKIPLLDSANHIRLLFAVAFAACVLAAIFWSALLDRRARGWTRWGAALAGMFTLAMASIVTLIIGLDHVQPNHELLVTYVTFIQWLLPIIALDALLVLVVFSLTHWPRLALGLAMLVMLAETGFHGMWYEPAIKPELHYPRTQLTTFLAEHAHVDRFISISSTAHLWPNLGAYYGFADPRVYDSLGVADHRRSFAQHVSTLGNSQGIVAAQAHYLDAIGVRYILARDEYELVHVLGLRQDELRFFEPVLTAPDYILYQNLRTWPRAFVVSSPDFFEHPDRVDLTSPVTIESYRNNSLSLLVTMPTDGYVTVSDTFYPGWAAHVDGVPYQIEQADLNFRSVPVRAGPHRIELRYEPQSVRFGIGLSVTGVILLMVIPLVVFIWRRRL